MRKEELCEILGDIREDYVSAAGELPQKRKRTIWIRWGVAAAVFILAVYAGGRTFLQDGAVVERDASLPMLTITDRGDAAMGFEGYMAYDISELVSANPWRADMELTTLPVYRNQLTFDSMYIASGVDYDKMHTRLLEAAARLGLDPEELTITDDAPDEETRRVIAEKMEGDVPEGYFDPTELIAETDALTIRVERDLTVSVFYEPGVRLPTEYHFSSHASYEELVAVAEYMRDAYHDFICMEDPQVNIGRGDYDIYREQNYQIEFFDLGESDVEKIINFNFNKVIFYDGEDGTLWLGRIFRPDLSDKMGDYPIITLEEAKELLLDGVYMTSVPYEMPGAEYVAKAELIYRTSELEEYFMPYYRFYVELPDEEMEDGLKVYGAYYVPAVEDAYLSNMPMRTGVF